MRSVFNYRRILAIAIVIVIVLLIGVILLLIKKGSTEPFESAANGTTRAQNLFDLIKKTPLTDTKSFVNFLKAFKKIDRETKPFIDRLIGYLELNTDNGINLLDLILKKETSPDDEAEFNVISNDFQKFTQNDTDAAQLRALVTSIKQILLG